MVRPTVDDFAFRTDLFFRLLFRQILVMDRQMDNSQAYTKKDLPIIFDT